MKPIVILFFILFSGISTAVSQTKETLQNIQEKYLRITESLEENKLKQNNFQDNCEASGRTDTSLSYYYSNTALVYLNYRYTEGHNNYNYHYYLWDDKLIFYFSDHASWAWDYECAPKEQGFTNEIWTYSEQRIYFNNEAPIQCLHKTFEEKPHQLEINLSDTIKNKNIPCDSVMTQSIIKRYLALVKLQKKATQNICNITLD